MTGARGRAQLRPATWSLPRRADPLVEVRLVAPLGDVPAAVVPVLAGTVQTALSGLGAVDPELPRRLRAGGSSITVLGDVDRLLLCGASAPEYLPTLLEAARLLLRMPGIAPAAATDEAVALVRDGVVDQQRQRTGADPRMAVDEALNRALYGDHAYGASPGPADLSTVSGDAVRAALSTGVDTGAARIVVVGPHDPGRVEDLVESVRHVPAPVVIGRPPPPAVRSARQEIVVAAEERVFLRIAVDAPAPGHPDEPAARLLAVALQESLLDRLRTRSAAAYAARADLLHAAAASKLVISLEVGADAEALALSVAAETLARASDLPGAADQDGWAALRRHWQAAEATRAGEGAWVADLLASPGYPWWGRDPVRSRLAEVAQVTAGQGAGLAGRVLGHAGQTVVVARSGPHGR